MMTKSDTVALENLSKGRNNQTSSPPQSLKQKNQRSLSVNALNYVPNPQQTPGSVLGSPPPSRGYKTIKDRCYYCGAADHSHEQCAKGEPVDCQKCMERGHLAKYCERYHQN